MRNHFLKNRKKEEIKEKRHCWKEKGTTCSFNDVFYLSPYHLHCLWRIAIYRKANCFYSKICSLYIPLLKEFLKTSTKLYFLWWPISEAKPLFLCSGEYSALMRDLSDTYRCIALCAWVKAENLVVGDSRLIHSLLMLHSRIKIHETWMSFYFLYVLKKKSAFLCLESGEKNMLW